MKYFHDMKGLLYGYDDWSNKDIPTWKNESHTYLTDVGDLVFYPGLIFVEGENEQVTTIDQTKVTISVKNNSINLIELKGLVENILETYLHVMSFLENRFLYWFRCEIDARSVNGKGMVSTIWKSVPKWEYKRNDHIARYSKEYREFVPKLVDGYQLLEAQRKDELNKAIQQLLIAAKPDQPFDTELIYWHSCLDILIKILSGDKFLDRKNIGFSKKLVLACEDAKIEWSDLYPYVKKEDIFSGTLRADFKITTIRNNMIHDGQYPNPNDFDVVFAENSRAEALAERIIIHILGVEYRGTPIGIFRQIR